MLTRSHWISIAVFFLCGVLTGGVIAERMVGVRHRARASALIDSFGASTTSDRAAMQAAEVWNCLSWLELSAAGRDDLACAEAERLAKAGMDRLRDMPEPWPGLHATLADRLRALDAGTPYVRLDLPERVVDEDGRD